MEDSYSVLFCLYERQGFTFFLGVASLRLIKYLQGVAQKIFNRFFILRLNRVLRESAERIKGEGRNRETINNEPFSSLLLPGARS